MPLTFDDIEELATSLPGVTVGARWGNQTWFVGDKAFAWHRPLSKADLGRLGDAPPPKGDILAVMVESLDAKDALLAMSPAGFFTIQHFNNYPALLIELRKARAKDVRAALVDAHRLAAAALPRPRKPRKPRKPRASPRSRGS